MTQISGGSGPSFRIGPTGPTNYARFSNAATPSWGSAISKIGGAWAARHNREKIKAANLALASEQAVKRQGWARDLSGGASLRDLAVVDPLILSDSDFIAFWDKSKPTPEAETFEIADSPFGRGGIGQRSSKSGKIIGYQSALAPEAPAEHFEDVLDPYGFGGAAQRSSTTGELTGYRAAPSQPQGRERKTATDQTGRLRYLDTGEPAFADSLFDQTPPEPDAPEPAKFEHVRALAGDWEDATKPIRDLSRQRDLMQIGLEKARAGDMAAGSQAVLVTFQKILDPTSVVRESEYTRSSSGLSMFERIRGATEKLGKGGAGVSVPELQSFARLADEAVTKLGSGWLTQERERIGRFADAYNVPRDYVFQSGGRAPQATAGPPQAQGLPEAAAPALAQAAPRQAQAQAADSPGFAALAKALTGPRTPARAPARAQAHAAAGMGPAPTSSLPKQRIQDYGTLKLDALKRQVATMAAKLAANPDAYSQAEIDAAKLAYDAAFPEG